MLKKSILKLLLMLFSSSLYSAEAQSMRLADALYAIEDALTKTPKGSFNNHIFWKDHQPLFIAASNALLMIPVDILENYCIDGTRIIRWLVEKNNHDLYTHFINQIQERKTAANQYTGFGIYGEDLALCKAISKHTQGRMSMEQVLEELAKTDAEALDIALSPSGKEPLLTSLIKNNTDGRYNQLIEAFIAKTVPSAQSALNHVDWRTQETPLAAAKTHKLPADLIVAMEAKGAIAKAPEPVYPTTLEEMDAFVKEVQARPRATTRVPQNHLDATPEQPRTARRAAPAGPGNGERHPKKPRRS